MTYVKSLVAVALFSAFAAQPAKSADIQTANTPLQSGQVQIAENVPAERRNVTAVRKVDATVTDGTAADGARTVQPPGAQALMALGLALIVTPAMFRGAFSN